MNTPSSTKPSAPIQVLHSVRIRPSNIADDTERTDSAYDLSGTAYRVILGCCTQEETIRNTDHSRLAPARAITSVRAKEVIS